ncbi:MAG TPA: TetR family transcriptional regulator, partial [Lentzea sp.]
EALAEAGPALLASADSPFAALRDWVEGFVNFLVTKHGLAAAMRDDQEGFAALHALLGGLVPVLGTILDAARETGEITREIPPYQLLRAIGDVCAGAERTDPDYDARVTVGLLLDGCRSQPQER